MATAPIPESEIDDDAEDAGPDLTDVHDRAMRRFDSVAVPQIEMRAMSLEDRRFVTIPGAMWEGPYGEQFENMPRPEVDKISKSLEKIETDYRENRLTVEFVPSSDADKGTASTINDMFRADAHNFKSDQAWDNALQEGIRGGFGAWRLSTDYADPYDDEDDAQRVNPGLTIVDADQSVYFDPASILYDASDAKWAFIISAWPKQDAIDRWGSLADFPTYKWQWQWEWFRPDVTLIAEYYEVEDKTDELLIFTQEQSGEEQRYYKSEMLDGQAAELRKQGWNRKSRACKRKRVHKYLMSGQGILKDCGNIAGDCIPIVPFYYRRDYVDNMPRWRGFVSKYKDPQRVYNSAVAKVIETNSISPQKTPIVYDEQLNPTILEEWASRNIDRKAVLRVMALRDNDGNLIAQQGVQYLDAPDVQPAAAALLQIASNDLTDQDDSTDQVAANVSAEAIELAQNRVDSKSGIALDNFRQSQLRGGEIYASMSREVNYEPGRIVDTMTADGQHSTAELQEPVLDQGVYRLRNDLTQGRFKVSASVTESTMTKRQKAQRQALELGAAFMQAQSPNDALAAFYTAAENMDGEGIDDLIAYFRQKSIAIGATKPTPEEQKAIEAAQQQKSQQPPDPKEVALQMEIQERQSKIGLNQAKAQDTQAQAALRDAQAKVLEKAPAVPQGLAQPPETPNPVDQVNTLADAHAKVAGANLDNAKADHLRQTIAHQRIKTGAEIAQQQHDQALDAAQHGLEVRKQDHVEAQPASNSHE